MWAVSNKICLCQIFMSLNVANRKVISTHQPGYLHKAVLVSHCAIFPFQPAAPFSTFVFLFSIHKCNSLNLKLFRAQVNDCNHELVVSKPREHMNKSAEGKRGSKKKRGEMQREKWNKTGSFFPSGLPAPQKCNQLNPWCRSGFSTMSQTLPNQIPPRPERSKNRCHTPSD